MAEQLEVIRLEHPITDGLDALLARHISLIDRLRSGVPAVMGPSRSQRRPKRRKLRMNFET